MNKARNELEELDFIRTELIEDQNQENIYKYELVEGMSLNYVIGKRQDLTLPMSEIDSPYIEEKNASPESRDDKARRTPRQLPEDRGRILDHMFEEISQLYSKHHPRHLAMPNAGSVRRVLKNFLLENKSWPESALINGIRNYYASAGTNKAKSPEQWIRRIPEFSTGPVDQYGHVLPEIDRWTETVTETETKPGPSLEAALVRPIHFIHYDSVGADEIPW